MTLKILEVVEFIEALESVDGMCAARESSVNQKRFWRDAWRRKINSSRVLRKRVVNWSLVRPLEYTALL
jgi:hypothetical protein